MKQFIIALFLLTFSISGIASTAQTPTPTPVIKEIPFGVEIRKDMVVMYLLCDKPFAISMHSPTGIRIFQGKDMDKKLEELNAANDNNGIPVVKTDLSNAWGDEVSCGGAGASKSKPEPKKRLPIEEMNKGRGPMWSASYQP